MRPTRREGFTLAEFVITLAIMTAMLAAALPRTNTSPEMIAFREAESLARWLRLAIRKADINMCELSIVGSPTKTTTFYIRNKIPGTKKWRSGYYSSEGRCTFWNSWSGTANAVYSPAYGDMRGGLLGCTIRIHAGSSLVCYVIISRYGRVRVSSSPPD